MAYITQAQAAVYSDVVGTLSADRAAALLDVASNHVDSYCGRTFDTVLEDLPAPVAMAVAILAEDLTAGKDAGRDKTSERIGDYSVSYESGAIKGVAYPMPPIVAELLGPYRIVVVG